MELNVFSLQTVVKYKSDHGFLAVGRVLIKSWLHSQISINFCLLSGEVPPCIRPWFLG